MLSRPGFFNSPVAAICIVLSVLTISDAVDARTANNPAASSWQKTYSADRENGLEGLNAATARPGGGFIAVGIAQRPRSMGRRRYDAWILSLDANGNTIWQKLLGGEKTERFLTVSTGPEGNILAAGVTGSSGAGGADGYVVVLDGNGAPLAEVTHGGKNGDGIYASVPDPDGGFVLAGYTEATSGFFGDRARAWVIRSDAMGKALWTKAFSEGNYAMFKGVSMLPDGGIVAVGSTGQGKDPDEGEGWVVRLDAGGNEIWRRTLERKGMHDLVDVVALPGGGFVAVGSTYPLAIWERAQGLVIRFDDRGTVLWERTIGKGYAQAASIEAGKDGSVVVAATTARVYDVAGLAVGMGVLAGYGADGSQLFRKALARDVVLKAVVPTGHGHIAGFGYIAEKPDKGRRNLSGFGGVLSSGSAPESSE